MYSSRVGGFSLAEILVGFAVLIPVLLIVVGLFPFAHRIDERAWALTLARNVGRAQMEQLRTQSFDTLPSRQTLIIPSGGTDFACDVSTDPYAGYDPAVLKQLTVSVRWTTSQGMESLQLVSLRVRS